MRDLLFPRYSQEVPKSPISGTLNGPNLAFVHVPQLDPSSPTGNINIADRSFRFPENTTLFANNIVKFNANLGLNDTSNILLTNKYSNTIDITTLSPINKTVPVRPLWYKYTFLTGFPLLANPNGTFTVRLIDNTGNEISQDHIVIDAPNGKFYTDIVNTLTVWYNVVYLSNSGQVTKLLSAEPVFREVSSFSPGLNNPEYIAQYDPVHNRFQIRTQADPSTIFSMLTIGTTKISVQHPVNAGPVDPWYLKISNGYFKRFVSSNIYEYGVPEYFTQVFNPEAPFNYQVGETPTFMSNNLLRLRQVPLVPQGVILTDVVVYVRFSRERQDTANYIINTAGGQSDVIPYTTNTISTVWCRLSIEDIDRTTGIVKINGVLKPNGTPISLLPDDNVIYQSDQLLAFYFYQELDLVFNKISLNPILNRALLTTGISIYITPARATVNGISYIATSTVAYLLFDENEIIIGASDPQVPLGITIDAFYAQTDSTGIPLMFNDRSTFLELARVFVRNVATIRDITLVNLVDTRIEGGRLIDTLPQEIIDIADLNTHGLYYLKDWGSVILPANSVVVIKVPTYLLNNTFKPGGVMLTGDALAARQLDIRRICKKHMAAGVLPVLRFYDNTTGVIRFDLNPPLDREFF